jgi:pSer/pThr/pTyr-binding forkhead associated (FHA) protein
VVLAATPPPAGAAAVAVPKARLVAVDSATTQEHALGAENTLGRVPENTIPVPNGSVSRHHATIRYAGGSWSIVDQKSENGTWVNGERVTERKLAHDDRINIGTVRFRFKLD